MCYKLVHGLHTEIEAVTHHVIKGHRIVVGSCITWGATTDIGRYNDRYSIDYRSILHRVQVDISVEYRPMYRPILLSVDILGGSPILHRYLTDTSPILHRCFTDTLVHTLVDTRPRLERSINALVLVDASADTLVDTSVDSIQYRSIVSGIGRYIGGQDLVSVNISVDTSVDSIQYRSIVAVDIWVVIVHH